MCVDATPVVLVLGRDAGVVGDADFLWVCLHKLTNEGQDTPAIWKD